MGFPLTVVSALCVSGAQVLVRIKLYKEELLAACLQLLLSLPAELTRVKALLPALTLGLSTGAFRAPLMCRSVRGITLACPCWRRSVAYAAGIHCCGGAGTLGQVLRRRHPAALP